MPETPVYITGKYATLTIDGAPACMDSWELNESAEPVDVTNWCSVRGPDGGVIRPEYEPGLIEGDFSASGPYKGLAPAIGALVPIVFGVNATLTAQRLCLVTSVKVSTELKGKATLSISGKICGVIT